MILLMGIAGSGKGTQGKLLAEKEGFHVISTGDLLREFGSEAQHARMLKGEILGDEEVTDLLDQALSKLPDQNNVILDGYPRRISQADWLLDQQKKGRFTVETVVHLMASREAVKGRLQQRGRVDDHDAGIEQRFSEYERDTVPILTHLAEAGVPVKAVDGERSVDEVHADIIHLLRQTRTSPE